MADDKPQTDQIIAVSQDLELDQDYPQTHMGGATEATSVLAASGPQPGFEQIRLPKGVLNSRANKAKGSHTPGNLIAISPVSKKSHANYHSSSNQYYLHE